MTNPKFQKTNEYLEYFSKKYVFHTRYSNIGRHKWLKYKSKEYKEFYKDGWIESPNHREIMPDEVIIDIDTKEKKVVKECIKQILKILTEQKINYSLWETGGKGVHFHTYWKGLNKHTLEDRKLLKELIIKYLCYGWITKAKIDMQLTSTHLIRCEHGIHEKTHYQKSYLEGVNELEYNSIPSEVMQSFNKIKEAQKNWKASTKTPNGTTPNCIKFLLSDDFVAVRDGRKNALFALASWNKKQGMNNEENIESLKKWNHYKLHDYLNPRLIEATVKCSNGTMTCRGRHSIIRNIGKQEVFKGCSICEEQEMKEGRLKCQ